MEAVTAILESGLRVGVVLQGKKVRDDNRTLEQAGISQNGNLDNLGFTLEPRFTQVSPSSSPNKPPASSTYVADQELTRYDQRVYSTSVLLHVLVWIVIEENNVSCNKFLLPYIGLISYLCAQATTLSYIGIGDSQCFVRPSRD